MTIPKDEPSTRPRRRPDLICAIETVTDGGIGDDFLSTGYLHPPIPTTTISLLHLFETETPKSKALLLFYLICKYLQRKRLGKKHFQSEPLPHHSGDTQISQKQPPKLLTQLTFSRSQ